MRDYDSTIQLNLIIGSKTVTFRTQWAFMSVGSEYNMHASQRAALIQQTHKHMRLYPGCPTSGNIYFQVNI